MAPDDDGPAPSDLADWHDDAQTPGCVCGTPDWPGRCPGPAFCPCARNPDEEDEE